MAFEGTLENAYSDLIALRGDDVWRMNRNQLISYLRSADKTSDVIGSRQAGVFIALRELDGHVSEQGQTNPSLKMRADKSTKPKSTAKQAKPANPRIHNLVLDQVPPPLNTKPQRTEMALTVRIEINLPAEGTQETYDAIFQSIKVNLYP